MKRTPQQQKAIEVYCNELAQKLNDAGYDFNDGKVIRLPVSFTQENVKEYMFKKIMGALYPDYVSTTELETNEVTEVYENVNRITADQFGVSLNFPSIT